MNPTTDHYGLWRAWCGAAVALLAGWPGHAPAQSDSLMLANPNWNITLSDYGYADLLLDNTPGFEGREYLSGEWATAIAYTAGETPVAPKWLEPQWVFPDWVSNSNFQVVSPIRAVGVNADNLPIAESVIANPDLRLTLRYEMLDTVSGTPMGATPASAAGGATALSSDRYVLKQTCTIQNLSASTVTHLQLFQLLHGLKSECGLYDNRPYPGPLGEFCHDITLVGLDRWWYGAGTTAGLTDYLAFHALIAPDAFEIGYFGIEGNGIDAHRIGKPSEGVHLSVEDNWQHPPYLSRLGTDWFDPVQRWVAGVQRWTLGSLAPNQTVSHDLLLTLLTGTKVAPGSGSSGSCNGGAGVAGGIDYQFSEVSSEGSCFGSFIRADDAELDSHVAHGEFNDFTFPIPGRSAQVWMLKFNGSYSGQVSVTLGYDVTLLPPGFDENSLAIYHFTDGAWQAVGGTVDPLNHSIAVSVAALGAFALAIDAAAPACAIAASAAPPDSGTAGGTGRHLVGTGVTLVATAAAGYGFVNWTEDDVVIGTSPTLVFAAAADRTLVANFIALGDNHSIATGSLPIYGGTTCGGGAYALNSSATLSAVAVPGYKFSKWLVDGVAVSSDNPYTFTVSGSLVVVAIFKPLFTVVTVVQPAGRGAIEAEPTYESGAVARLKAIPFPGYAFVNWTQNGALVSTQASFSFNVTGNRTLVANFAYGNRIQAIAEPPNAGVVSGAGVYETAQSVVLMAQALPGYLFTNWTEGVDPVVVVASSPSLSFNATISRSLQANFIVLPNISMHAPSPGTLLLAWPAAATGWQLEESTDLSRWADSTRPFSIEGTRKQVIITESAGTRFFRLRHP